MARTHREGAEYALAVSQATQQLQSLEEAGDWPLSERLKAFFFMLLDAVEAQALVAEPSSPAVAFRRDASGWFSPFQEALRAALPEVGSGPSVHGVNRWLASLAPNRAAVAEVMVQLIQASLPDTSDERQRSAALADRVLTVLASAWSTPLPAQLLDVLRYSVEAGYVPVDRWPLFRQFFDSTPVSGKESGKESGRPSSERPGTTDAG